MSDENFTAPPSGPSNEQPAAEPAWGAPPPNSRAGALSAASAAAELWAATDCRKGLSDTAASALAYVTFIPALIFLLVAPYNQKPDIRFHAIQELGLTVVGICLHFSWSSQSSASWSTLSAGWACWWCGLCALSRLRRAARSRFRVR